MSGKKNGVIRLVMAVNMNFSFEFQFREVPAFQ